MTADPTNIHPGFSGRLSILLGSATRGKYEIWSACTTGEQPASQDIALQCLSWADEALLLTTAAA